MKLKDGFVLRGLGGECAAVSVGKRIEEFPDIIVLSETAAFIWRLLQKDRSMEQLTEALVSEYEVDRDTAAGDLVQFVKSLEEKHLLEEGPSGGEKSFR